MKLLPINIKFESATNLIRHQCIFAILLLFTVYPSILFAQNNYVFGPSIIVNDDPPGTHNHGTTQRAVVCRSDTVYLVWGDNRYGSPIFNNSRVFFSKSTDAGNTWSPNLLISQDINNYPCFDAQMCLDAFGDIYVAYCGMDNNTNNKDIYLVKSTDGGGSFTPPLLVNDSTEGPHQVYPACAVDSLGQNVYVVWEDGRNPQYSHDIYLSRSSDGGATFLPSVRVNDDTDTTYQWFPVIACDNSGQNVYVAWMDERDSLHGWDVYFSRSADYGQTFEPNYPVNDTITTGNTPQDYPNIYYKDGIIYAVWHDGRDGYAVYFGKSTDGGLSFGSNVRVSDDPDARGYFSSITADDSANVYIVWRDWRDFSTYGHDIYFSFSSDSGQIFNQNVLVNDHLGVIGAWDWDPSICVNEDGKVFVAWKSDRNDASHTYFDVYCAAGTYVGIQEVSKNQPAIILQCYPNPFFNRLTIKFQITKTNSQTISKSQITMKVYDVTGRLVKSFDRVVDESPCSVIWKGTDDYGQTVPVGVYFVELVNKNNKYVKKIVKIGGAR